MAVLLGVVVLLGPPAARAHHTTQASRLGPAAGRLVGQGVGAGLTLGLDYSYARLDTTLRGSEAFPADDPVVVGAHTARLRVAYEAASGLYLEAQAPFAALAGARGLADLELLGGLGWGGASWRARASALAVLPTGRYDPRPAVTSTEIGGGVADLRLTTHEARATVGTGAPWLGGVAGLALALAPAWRLELGGELRAPLTAAADGARFGPAARLEALAARDLLGERLTLAAGLGIRWRGDDRLPAVLEHDTLAEPVRGGAARELRGLVAAGLALGAGGQLSLGLDLPLARHVAGVQLVDAFALTLGLSWRWDLAAR